MSRRWPLALLFTVLFAVAFGFLVSGTEWVSVPLFPAWPLPAGNLLAAVIYISLAALTVVATRSGTPARGAAWVLMAASVLWLPVSLWLAGNLNLNFAGGWQGEVWIFYTYKALPVGCLLLLLWRLVHLAVKHSKRRVAPEPEIHITPESTD